MATETETLTAELTELETTKGRLDPFHKAWHGEQASAYLSTKSKEALDTRLRRLSVNFPRLVVRSLADRLTVTGFRRERAQPAGEGTAAQGHGEDAATWRNYSRAGLVSGSELIHTDRSLYGAAYVTVWGHGNDSRRPVVMLDNPRTARVVTDPATGDVVRAVRSWTSDGHRHALLMLPSGSVRFRARDIGSGIPLAGSSWQAVEHVENPWGVVPVVPFVRRQSTDDHDTGTSLVTDILDLTDAVSKVLQDAMVTSEYFARPRRWATGLEIQEDKAGNPVDPFGEGRFLQSEDPETKFGQLDSSRLDGYADLTATLTQQVGALSGLPPHYLGLHGDQPPNADSIRASETQLTMLAYSEHRQLGPDWSRVAAWLHAVADGADLTDDYVTLWESPETRTPAQAADAATKLHGIGVPLGSLLTDPLGYEPDTVATILSQRDRDQITRAASSLGGTGGLMP